jgi:hypothetical protein
VKKPRPDNAQNACQAQAGTLHVDWLPQGIECQTKRSNFTLKGGDWEEITVELIAEGPLGIIVRLYLPMQEKPVEIDRIELTSKNSTKLTLTGF